MKLCADRLMAIVIIDAFKDEMKKLREWYFYKPEHSDFNAFYYEFLEAVNKPHTSLEEQVEICYEYYSKAVDYMNVFYPDNRMDVELLSFDMDNPYYPDVIVNFRSPFDRKRVVRKSASRKTSGGKKQGRPKGSKNKKTK
ncbi:MAG: hypothetical protein IKK18_00680 [Clostridia bacterium]|nr:hypothetical protein [Clostridia bacterium]